MATIASTLIAADGTGPGTVARTDIGSPDEPDLIVSTNDAKYQRVAGTDTYPPNPVADTVTVIDARARPMRIVTTVNVAASVAGPPQAVAINSAGTLVIVSAPTRYDTLQNRLIFETYLQVIDLEAAPAQVVAKIELQAHPQALAINRAGTLLLVTTVAGTVDAFAIAGKALQAAGQIELSKGRLAGVSFTPDGQSALVAARDDGGLYVLDIEGTRISTRRGRVTTGLGPYTIDVSRDGRWAVVSNVGLAGLPGDVGTMAGDVDSLTLIDVSRRPFRAVQHLTVPSLPEGVAISPDGRWIAALTMGGSNLKPDNPGRHSIGKIVLFEIRDGVAYHADELPAGEAGQGIVFTADSRYLIAQFNVEKQLAVYAITGATLQDTGQRLAVTGGPSSIRSMPR